jgi:hypothetical protein
LNRQKVSQAYRQLPEVLEIGIRAMGFSPPPIVVQWNQRMKLSPLEKSYQRINTALRIIRCPPPIHYTPSERATTLLKALPEATVEINQLLEYYQQVLYGKGKELEIETRPLEQKILRLAWKKRLQDELANLFSRNE